MVEETGTIRRPIRPQEQRGLGVRGHDPGLMFIKGTRAPQPRIPLPKDMPRMPGERRRLPKGRRR
jgi:hypothetical protein